MDNDFKIEENVEELSNEELINLYNEVEAFLKTVDDELKKTNTGDENE